MPATREKLVVLFADISGSTALYDTLGDALARSLIARCLATLCAEMSKQHGVLIKTLGDEIMCTFDSVTRAFEAARAMQRAVQEAKYERNYKLAVRLGFHYGEVIREADDIYGDTVNVAARVAAITRAGQIMTTLATTEYLPPELRVSTRQVMRAELKGKQEHFDIFQVLWELDDGMSTRIGIPAFRKIPVSNDELILSYQGQTVVVNQAHRTAILGRDPNAELIVHSDFASRQHVRIELRYDKFVLVDQSTNGTYIRAKNDEIIYLVREEMVLKARGVISLGNPDFEAPGDGIEYVIRSRVFGQFADKSGEK